VEDMSEDDDDDEADVKADGEAGFAGATVDDDDADLVFWAGPITCSLPEGVRVENVRERVNKCGLCKDASNSVYARVGTKLYLYSPVQGRK